MIKNPILKNVLTALLVAVLGFILLNLTFVFDALYQGLVRAIIRPFSPEDIEMSVKWYPPLLHWSFVVVIGIISWFVFKSKISTFWKAVYLCVPVAVVMATIGLSLADWPIVVYALSVLFSGSFLYYFITNKKPWLYSFSVIFVSLALLLMMLTGVEI